jgi:hypothetical protein
MKNIKIFKIGLMLLLLFVGVTAAQECGPSCPVCSGAGTNSGALLKQNSMLFSGLTIPTADEERVVLNIRYGFFEWLDAGMGYAIRTEKVLWNVRTQPILEQEDGIRPGVIFGTGSVQMGGSDQSLYAQLIKSWKPSSSLVLQYSGGAATLLPDFDETYALAGITAIFYERYLTFVNYDGKSYHEGVSWIANEGLSFSFLLVESEFPAFSISLNL